MGKSKVFCCVPGCNSLAGRSPELSFHYFPREGQSKVTLVNETGITEIMDCRKAWEINFKMNKPVTRFMRVCSKHFKPEDYVKSTKGKGIKRLLKRYAVPSQNLPETNTNKRSTQLDELQAVNSLCFVASEKTYSEVAVQATPSTNTATVQTSLTS